VGEPFFTTMEIPILLGRGFTKADVNGSTKAVVVNETFVQQYLRNDYPIGQILQTGESDNDRTLWQIVGVCRDAKYTDIKKTAPPTVYFSFRQDQLSDSYVALRTKTSPFSFVGAARNLVGAINPSVPLSDITTQKAVRDQGISQETLFATLCSALALLAVMLSCIGLYGLMAYNVTRRTSEIGIRMALGATRRNIAGPILREAATLAGLGLGIGALLALAVSHLIQSQLYGVADSDPMTFVGAGILLITVVILAAWVPARRAACIEPMAALRHD